MPELVSVNTRVVSGSVVDVIDRAILELESDKATLERAKEILERR